MPDSFEVPASETNLLLLVSGDSVFSPKLNSIKSYYSKRDDLTTIFISGKNLKGLSNVYLLEPYEKGKSQQRIPCTILSTDEKNKKLKMNVDASLLNFDKYVLFYENETGSIHTYVQLNSKNQIKKIKMTPLEAEELFYGPEASLSTSENLQEPGITSLKLQKKDWLVKFDSQQTEIDNLEELPAHQFASVSQNDDDNGGTDLVFGNLSTRENFEKGSAIFVNTSADFTDALKTGNAVRFSVKNTGNNDKYWIIKLYALDSKTASENKLLQYEIAVKIKPNTNNKVTVPYENFKCVSKKKSELKPENIIGFAFVKENENKKEFASNLEISDFYVCDLQVLEQVEKTKSDEPILCTAAGVHVGLATTSLNPFSTTNSPAFFVDAELRVLDLSLFDLDVSAGFYPSDKIFNANVFGKIFTPTTFGYDVLYFGAGAGYQNKPVNSDDDDSGIAGGVNLKFGFGCYILHMIDLRFSLNTYLPKSNKFKPCFSDEFSVGFVWKYRKANKISSGGDL